MNSKHAAVAGGIVALAIVGLSIRAFAADHDEPGTTSFTDVTGDIGDVYAFHDDENLTLVMTFAGYKLALEEAEYDSEVLYTFNIDTSGDAIADEMIHVRFGQAEDGSWGVQVVDVPGVDVPIVGPVDAVTEDEASGTRVFAGYRDDPFFFDLQGYRDTLMTGTLSFDPERDFVSNKNTGAIVIEIPQTALSSRQIQVWATSGRL